MEQSDWSILRAYVINIYMYVYTENLVYIRSKLVLKLKKVSTFKLKVLIIFIYIFFSIQQNVHQGLLFDYV